MNLDIILSIIPNIQFKGNLISSVQGEYADIIVYKCAPYSTPPIGKLRWCPNHPVFSWEGVRKCNTFSKFSIKKNFMISQTIINYKIFSFTSCNSLLPVAIIM